MPSKREWEQRIESNSRPESDIEIDRRRQRSDFRVELESVINKCSMEDGSNTPDSILAMYLVQSLQAFGTAVRNRDHWYGVNLSPGTST